MSSSSASAPSAAAVAQQEAALRKLEAERDRLVAEVLTLQEAMSTSKACEECVAAAASRRAGGEAGASLARLLVSGALAHPASFAYDARARSGAHLRANRRLVPPRSPRARRLVKYVESTPEPFAEGGKDGGPNPWTQQVVGGQQCCVVT